MRSIQRKGPVLLVLDSLFEARAVTKPSTFRVILVDEMAHFCNHVKPLRETGRRWEGKVDNEEGKVIRR